MGACLTETLFDYAQRAHTREFGGATYDEKRDGDRLKKQLAAVRSIMLRNGWMTLEAISEQTGAPQASVSARIRDLRKSQFGGYTIEREYVSKGLWRYRIAIGGGK
jgi:hypothetical protein